MYKFIGAAKGIGRESGRPWYRIDLACMQSDGTYLNGSFFTVEGIYNEAIKINAFEEVKITWGPRSAIEHIESVF